MSDQRPPFNRTEPSDLDLNARIVAARREAVGKLMAVADVLGCRPDPRGVWDEIARGRVVIDKDVVLCRRVLDIAERKGPKHYRAAILAVREYFAAKQDAALLGHHIEGECLTLIAPKFAKEAGEAAAAAFDHAMHPTPERRSRLRREALEAHHLTKQLLEGSAS